VGKWGPRVDISGIALVTLPASVHSTTLTQSQGMSTLPLVRFPARTAVYRFGAPATASRGNALLRFEQGLTIPKEGRQGWAIVGDGEGRRLAVEVSHSLVHS
jgi:hypothetical protein